MFKVEMFYCLDEQTWMQKKKKKKKKTGEGKILWLNMNKLSLLHEYLLVWILQIQMDKQVRNTSLFGKSHFMASISNCNGLLPGVNITCLAKSLHAT